MSELTVNFKFEIGDLVFLVASPHNRAVRPKHFQIYERLAEQCHGGVQKLYKLTQISEHVPEIALTRQCPAYEPIEERNLQIMKLDEYRWEQIRRSAVTEVCAERRAKTSDDTEATQHG